MSELLNNSGIGARLRWNLLAGTSALALAAYAALGSASAEDDTLPSVWIDLGGQVEQIGGLSNPFTAPFMTAVAPTPAPYRDDIFVKGQEPARFAFGLDGKATFRPKDSDWIVSLGIRYGRSQAKRHIHHQTDTPTAITTVYKGYPTYGYKQVTARVGTAAIADVKTTYQESHTIIDFQAGKDVGLGILGRNGTSNLNVGVRFAQFQAKSSSAMNGLPSVGIDSLYSAKYGANLTPNFHQYTMHANAVRSFSGVGAILSWNASAALVGQPESGELAIDFGVNAAVLFGRQKAKTDHTTQSYHNYYTQTNGPYHYYHEHHLVYSPRASHSTRFRNVAVPNIGGYAGLSWKWPNAAVNLVYRYDAFLNAMDIGIDSTKKSTLSFHGPYASISIGLGG